MTFEGPRALAAAGLVALALAGGLLGGCGGDGDATATALGAGAWRERGEAFCRDGLEEATALPLPASVPDLGPDAAARAEILARVRDGILTLGQPDGLSPLDVSAYVDALGSDIELLGRISQAARSGSDTQELTAQLDESAGQLADRLGLTDCAGLANAIARTP